MRIRKIREEDAKKVSELIHRTLVEINSKDYSQRVIQNMKDNFTSQRITKRIKKRDIYVAVDSKKILGTASLDNNVILSFFVDSKNIGKGIGSRLLKFLENKIKKKGFKEAKVPSSITALDFYKKLGYREYDRKNDSRFGLSIYMKKIL